MYCNELHTCPNEFLYIYMNNVRCGKLEGGLTYEIHEGVAVESKHVTSIE
jgi:hypothetical protein